MAGTVDSFTSSLDTSRPPEDIHRKLHDIVVPQVFVLSTGLTAIHRHPERSDSADLLSDLLQTANRVLSDLRAISRGESDSVAVKVDDIVRELWESTRSIADFGGCKVSVSTITAGDQVLSPDLGHDVRAVMWEAVANAIRHGHATEVDIRIELDSGSLIVEVIDNGTWAGGNASGTGLAGLGRRAETRGGDLEVRPVDGRTRLRWSAPYSDT